MTAADRGALEATLAPYLAAPADAAAALDALLAELCRQGLEPAPLSAPVAEATAVMFRRYQAVLEAVLAAGGDGAAAPDKTGAESLLWLSRTGAAEARQLPIDKVSRWLGFVQGVLCARGAVSVDGERDFSRPLFHAAYRAGGREPPPTREQPRP